MTGFPCFGSASSYQESLIRVDAAVFFKVCLQRVLRVLRVHLGHFGVGHGQLSRLKPKKMIPKQLSSQSMYPSGERGRKKLLKSPIAVSG
jgi:hypothetical protein